MITSLRNSCDGLVMLYVVAYSWGKKYREEYVDRLRRGIARNLRMDHRFALISDDGRQVKGCESWLIPDEDLDLTTIPGCLARLRLFDPQYLAKYGASKVIVVDLDTVITGSLDRVFDRPEPFVIFQGCNSINPCPYNGSTWMLSAGYRPDVWSDFSLAAASNVPNYLFPEDQAWMAYKIPNAAGWRVGPSSGLYGFKKKHWPTSEKRLPRDAKIVTFVGTRDPIQYTYLDWIKEHWLAEYGFLHPEDGQPSEENQAFRSFV